MKSVVAFVSITMAAFLLAESVSSFATPRHVPHQARPTALFMADSQPPQQRPQERSQKRQASNSKQKEYGDSLELPESYVRCGRCQTIYAITEDDLGTRGKGCRLECSVCSHSWFQSRDRIMSVKDGFEMIPLPENDLLRIARNMEEGRAPNYVGDSKLYVGNIAFECNEQDLFELFQEAGGVGEVSLVRDELGKNRGFGFITMRNKEDGDKAMEMLDGKEVRGRNIAVREANN